MDRATFSRRAARLIHQVSDFDDRLAFRDAVVAAERTRQWLDGLPEPYKTWVANDSVPKEYRA
jgi:hypothetical protein